MNKVKKVFLDTSVMVDRLCKDNVTKNRVEKILSRYDKRYTSNYTRMEFKRGPLQYLVYLHGKVALCENLTEVFATIRKLSATHQRNRLSSVLENVENFYKRIYETKPSEIIKEYGDISLDEYCKEMAESYLSNLIHNAWRKYDKVVDELINPTKCFVDIKAPQKEGKLYNNKPRTCHSSKYKCENRRFITNQTEKFAKILQKLKEIPDPDDETKKRIKVLKEVLRKPKMEIRVEDCWRIGDAIIAVEAPEEADIFNNNQKHFVPICEAIGKGSVGYDY